MAKKKKRSSRRPKSEKPLLTVTGVLHLHKSFVPPTQESGLLNTVTSDNVQALVLAPNYGYGIPASIVAQLETEKELEETEAIPPNVVQVNGVTTITTDKNVIELNEDFPMGEDKQKESNPETLSIAELVRSIGGAADKPFMRSDVVEDTKATEFEIDKENEPSHNNNDEKNQSAIDEDYETAERCNVEEPSGTQLCEDNEEDDFYESIGFSRPKIAGQPVKEVVGETKEQNNGSSTSLAMNGNIKEQQILTSSYSNENNLNSTNQQQNSNEMKSEENESEASAHPSNYTESIADYYKTYCQHYFSADPDPYGDERLEFGHTIAVADKDQASDNKTVMSNYANDEDQSIIELARMAQRARRAMEAATLANKQLHLPLPAVEEEAGSYDPLPMEIISSATDVLASDTTMEQYWEYVKVPTGIEVCNTLLITLRRKKKFKNVSECRKAYSAFLPLFPYCFGYWKRYSDLEKSFLYFHRALAILQRGLDFNPLSVDMWLTYLKLYSDLHAHDKNFHVLMREQYEKALNCAGLEFRSDGLWDAFLDWEYNNKYLKNVFVLYRRLLHVPTRLYNRHWDNFKALVRDHHPRDFLNKTEYEQLRKRGCKVLKFRYREEPEIEPGEIVKTSKPEDKLMAHVKEKILSKLEKTHKLTVIEADKRWDYEDRIKRPYFHCKPLDKGQLRNWTNYLNFEIAEGNHDRIVLLFERCLIACAQYEAFWCKYARYLEVYHRKESNIKQPISIHCQKSQINFDIGSQNKEVAEEEAIVSAVTVLLSDIVEKIVQNEEVEKQTIEQVVASLVSNVCALEESGSASSESKSSKSDQYIFEFSLDSGEHGEKILGNNVSVVWGGETVNSVALSSNSSELPPNSVECEKNDYAETLSSFTSLLSVPVFPTSQHYWHDVVRDVYKRACIVHCPDKPVIRLQWAAFEEEIENVKGAKELILHVIGWYPDLLNAKSQLIELERRAGNKDQVLKQFENYLKAASNCIPEYSSIAIKYARFLYKELGKADKALTVLRKAVKKDKGNHLLYNYVFDICHERFPTDRKGAAAALELALQSKDIKSEHKLQFVKKKVLFLQEHGELRKYRDAVDQLYELQEIVKVEMAANETARTNRGGGIINNFLMPLPPQLPAWNPAQDYIPISFEPVRDSDEASEKLPMSQQNSENGHKLYKSVPPTAELVQDGYGYGTHPDSKLQEYLSHQEYDKLVARGYPEELKDKEPSTTNYGQKRKYSEIPTYIIPPKGEFLMKYLKTSKNSCR